MMLRSMKFICSTFKKYQMKIFLLFLISKPNLTLHYQPYPTLPYPTLPYPTLPYPTLPLTGLWKGLALIESWQGLDRAYQHWYINSIDAHTGGGDEGGIKVYPPSQMFVKLVNINAIKHQKVYPPPKIFITPIYPPSQNLAKTSTILPLEFQTVCIYVMINSWELKSRLGINLNQFKLFFVKTSKPDENIFTYCK
jgi:hypothetical protein